MPENTFETHSEVYKYSHSAYRPPSFLFYDDSVIKSCKETQQGDPESPGLFSDSIRDLIDIWSRNKTYCTLSMEI